jgi:lipoprotein-releasing system ATP-binding protein
MLQVSPLTFSYSPSAQLAFPAFECTSMQPLLITGASGSGKSTLLHLLAGLLQPHSGTIALNKVMLSQLSRSQCDRFRGQHIGIVFQQPHFVAALSVLDNLLLTQYLATKKTNRQQALQLLSSLQLQPCAAQKPASLSAGQKQRLSIARAVINQPLLLLADEPTSSLDDENAQRVANLLQQQAANCNSTLLIVTHDNRLKQRFAQTLSLC